MIADVVVVGYGGAGAAAAITAHDHGAQVLVLESMDKGGGNTRVSMGGFLCPTDVPDAINYFTALYDLSHSEKDEVMIRVFAEESVHNVEWLTGLKEGTKVHTYGHAGFPHLDGAQAMNKYLVDGDNKGQTAFAANLWSVLSYAVEEQRKIKVLTSTPAQHLLTGDSNEIIGISALHNGREIRIKARRGVILTTGGYEYDQRLLQNHVKGHPIYAAGNPGNKGDGVRMAQKVGAALWHMTAVSCGLGLKVPEFESGFLIMIGAPGYIIVDRMGHRFMNEQAMEAHAGLLAVDYYDAHALLYPRIPCYAIFDEMARAKGPISRLTGMGSTSIKYRWSRDNSSEIERGWIAKGETIEELAEHLHLDPKSLKASVDLWNKDVRKGQDSQFNRPIRVASHDRPAYSDFTPTILSAPIENPPFYGLELYPCLANTQGGPKRNSAGQVLDAFEQVIPRLYSAGELGSMWGSIYQGAGNIAECLVFGRIAGKNASGEHPYEV